MEASFKILFTLGGYYANESLFNYTTFRPIWSGATVPLSQDLSIHVIKSHIHLVTQSL